MPNEPSRNPRYNSELYVNNDDRQRELNLKVLDLLQMAFSSQATECHQFLDIGCGTGDFTRDWLLSRCPPCKRIIAVDASEDMLAYARQHCTHPSIEFEYLNIGDDVSNFAKKYGKFDRIYSFFCLNWVKDQAQAMKNVSTLLTSRGECLLVFPAWSPTRMLWRKVAKLDRWSKFSKMFEGFVPKSQDLEDDDARISYAQDILRRAGLEPSTCVLLYVQPNYGKPEAYIDMQLSLNPAWSLATSEEREALRNDVTAEVLKWTSESAYSARPSLYVIHARKIKT
ncbi:juvenile hormone acid O-methyltransferase-like [Dermacentor andersoni]|uniref:juvenile hormone acid O-methyltransferase-like n=1 Tax=Dermacentor andersoni TaxID=34620 RepID=UPI002417A20E|nr:juvenile hormone acid O-methyltransferase-like [Dermacentor andersoni]XP_054933777.1 juvenile hormone acid O-methyltransferase-like [Dermacentor andersoni]